MKTPLSRIRSGAVSLILVFLISTVGYHFIGDYDWLSALWMVVITISTVGFSESSQATPAVQLFTIGVILLGVSSAAYTCGGFIQLLLEGEVDRVLGNRKMTMEIAKLKDHVIVCGFGRLGQDLVNQLRHRSIPYVVIDLETQRTELAVEEGAFAIQGDATSDSVLEKANLATARALVTALPTDAENVFITLTARNQRPTIQIIAKSEHENSCRKLRQAGADKIVMPHRVGAQQMERMITRPSTADLVELFAEASHLEMELDEVLIRPESSLVGLTLEGSKVKKTYNLLVVGMKDEEGKFQFNPAPEANIGAGYTLLIIGNVGDINRMKADHLT
ncbi:MAG: voltage-gated potassium channel [Mariniblastus sp.]|jgi:voltage-gated potassium channel